MVIEPYDSFLRFIITSQTDPDTSYLVELDSYWQNGTCSCQDFTFRHQPFLVRGEYDKGDSTSNIDKYRCKHIRVIREIFCDYMVRLLAKKQEAQA